MTPRERIETFRQIRAAYDACNVAHDAADVAWKIGREPIAAALAEQRASLQALVEEACEVDWCPPDELIYVANLLSEGLDVLGLCEAIAHLGISIGVLFAPLVPNPD